MMTIAVVPLYPGEDKNETIIRNISEKQNSLLSTLKVACFDAFNVNVVQPPCVLFNGSFNIEISLCSVQACQHRKMATKSTILGMVVYLGEDEAKICEELLYIMKHSTCIG